MQIKDSLEKGKPITQKTTVISDIHDIGADIDIDIYV